MIGFIKDVVATAGFAIGRCQPQPEIEALIRSLRPVTTNAPLIRIGGDGDGGYLVPDDLQGIAACFSPGVDVTASFEKDLISRGIPCFLADASVEQPPISGPLVHFEKKFLGVSDQGKFTTLASWVNRNNVGHGDLILQMDIEGAEWAVLLNAPDDLLSRFRTIVLELHGMHRLIASVAFPIMEATFDRLLHGFHVVHVHPNNVARPVMKAGLDIYPCLEITFYRKDRSAATGYAKDFPHKFDKKNVASKPDVLLKPAWYSD